jgi:hypothetical protein
MPALLPLLLKKY